MLESSWRVLQQGEGEAEGATGSGVEKEHAQ
jgi:hypothetical protein